MPYIPLKCTKCEHREEFLKIRSDEVVPSECSECGAPLEKDVPKGTGFILKGGGWFKGQYSTGKKGK